MRKKTLLLVIVGSFIFAYYWCFYAIRKGFQTGKTHEYLRLQISNQYIYLIKDGLEKYRNTYGHYPITNSKYYIDSIINFIDIPKPYLYQDSIQINSNPVLLENNLDSNKIKEGRFFIGIGRPENIIYYSCIDGKNYDLHYEEDSKK